MPKFAAGVVRFQQEVFPDNADLFEKLAKGQAPEALFITCSDSRIETGMLTQSEPGDLFIVAMPATSCRRTRLQPAAPLLRSSLPVSRSTCRTSSSAATPNAAR